MSNMFYKIIVKKIKKKILCSFTAENNARVQKLLETCNGFSRNTNDKTIHNTIALFCLSNSESLFCLLPDIDWWIIQISYNVNTYYFYTF